MCLAIYKPKGVEIAKRYLKNGFANNQDGAGFAFIRDGKIEIRKGFFTFSDFWKAYRENKSEPALIHFRWTTHGTTNEANCHPFEICGGQFAVIHNGIIDIDTSSDASRSDTWHYATKVLQPLVEMVPFDLPALRFVVESSIEGSKIAVLRADGECVIFNESLGEWHNGAWYSNDGYKRKPWASVGYGCGYGSLRGETGGPVYSSSDLVQQWLRKKTGWRADSNPTTKRESFPDYEGRAYGAEDADWTEEDIQAEIEASLAVDDEEEASHIIETAQREWEEEQKTQLRLVKDSEKNGESSHERYAG
jgi:hypothetical protein